MLIVFYCSICFHFNIFCSDLCFVFFFSSSTNYDHGLFSVVYSLVIHQDLIYLVSLVIWIYCVRVSVCLHMCIYITNMPGACKGQKKLDPAELVMAGYEPSCKFWELNPGPQLEQVLLSTEHLSISPVF